MNVTIQEIQNRLKRFDERLLSTANFENVKLALLLLVATEFIPKIFPKQTLAYCKNRQAEHADFPGDIDALREFLTIHAAWESWWWDFVSSFGKITGDTEWENNLIWTIPLNAEIEVAKLKITGNLVVKAETLYKPNSQIRITFGIEQENGLTVLQLSAASWLPFVCVQSIARIMSSLLDAIEYAADIEPASSQ